ncbi:MAG: hypothetical protein ACRC9K_13025 [Afipia sp.]
MIALLIGGTVVLCIGLLTVVFGIPIKEFSFGNTMILAGAVVSCTGLVLIGLYFIGREFRNLTRRLEAGIPIPAPVAPPRELEATASPRSLPAREDTLFTRDQPQDEDEFADDTPLHDSRGRAPSPLGSSAPPAAWQDHPLTRARHSAPAESFDPPAESTERPARRNIMFSSHRRSEAKGQDLPPRDLSPPDDGDQRPPAEDYQPRDPESEAGTPFESAWPSRSRAESSVVRNGRAAPPSDDRDPPEPARERFQPPRRADASSVTIVKSGVVDSMAYSLYSDGSIEAQMPEGMVRFASIDELRAHLDERG